MYSRVYLIYNLGNCKNSVGLKAAKALRCSTQKLNKKSHLFEMDDLVVIGCLITSS